jgi:two-component sensor histidine kinase
MALHELHTNTVKYGALSNDFGTIHVEWQIIPGDEPKVTMVWQEGGGPEVKQPGTRGFGSRMIKAALVRDLGRVDEFDHA